MTTFKALCIKDEIFVDGNKSVTLKRGKEYIIGPTKNEHVTVFTSCWFSVPASLFAGIVSYTK